MQNKHLVVTILKKYNLGPLTAEPEVLVGGYIHTNYKVSTNLGKFIIKIMNKTMYLTNCEFDKERLFSQLDFTEVIAKEMKKFDIPAVTAVRQNESIFNEIENEIIVVYPYIDGSICLVQSLEKKRINAIGKILKKIHSLENLNFNHDYAKADWEKKVELIKALDKIKPWEILKNSPVSSELLAHMNEVTAFMGESLWHLARHNFLITDLKMTHNDLKPKNIIWDCMVNPHIIDWDTASYMLPSTDYIDTLIAWSSEIKDGKLIFFPENAKFFSQGYSGMGLSSIEEISIYLVVAKWIVWVVFLIEEFKIKRDKEIFEKYFLEAIETINFVKKK